MLLIILAAEGNHDREECEGRTVSIIELGALGEFVWAIAVVVTLIYLAIQIRQNTRAMDEGRRLALAQTYQMRAREEA